MRLSSCLAAVAIQLILTMAAARPVAAAGAGLRVEDERILAETQTLRAVLERGVLTSLVRVSDGRELVRAEPRRAAVGVLYPKGEWVPLGNEPGDQVQVRRINATRAEFRVASWNGDAVVTVSVDPGNGDLVVEPSVHTSRPGLRACRWTLWGIETGLELVAPFFQGIQMPLEDALLRNSRWHWPMFWEAGFVVLQGDDGGFWVRCEDTRYRYKAVQVGLADDARVLGFETEAYGPADANLSAGGLAWRINVHGGDWREPAGQYRDWLAAAYGLREAQRPAWVGDLRLAISWCPTSTEVLDALARQVKPEHVLLHLPNWRTDPYDENYPTYRASDQARAFLAKAKQLGFRVMPHCNSVDMDPTHPVYQAIRDFQYRDIESKQILGWVWHDGQGRPVPESNAARLRHRDKKTMVKVHPGLGFWRSVLVENVQDAAQDLGLEAVFLDVTLTTWNLHNSVVEYQTSSEGMLRLEREVGAIGDGLVVGGEGRNEITMQGQALSQVHLFKSWQSNIAGFERLRTCPLNEFLFGRWSRSFGYSGLSGRDAASQLRLQRHQELGAIRTITIRSAKDLEEPNATVAALLRAAGN